jgi:rfaE bifunctional protein kinase chain/domain
MSQEDPTIVVTPVDSKRFIGGAGIVAAHASGLGAKVNFFSVTGNDEARKYALSNLGDCNVAPYLLLDESRPTTLKQRYRSKGKSLLRVSYLHEADIPQHLQDKLFDAISKVITEIDALVFSDFNYGCLPQSLVERISALALEKSVFIAADSQSSSQLGDIGRFKGMNLITPTEREARISTRDKEAGLVVLAEQLRVIAKAQNVLLKMGEEGLLIHACVENKYNELVTDRVDALNSNPKDVAGAGDSLLITSALALAGGANIWEAACLGSIAASIQVGRIGNTPLNRDDIKALIS